MSNNNNTLNQTVNTPTTPTKAFLQRFSILKKARNEICQPSGFLTTHDIIQSPIIGSNSHHTTTAHYQEKAPPPLISISHQIHPTLVPANPIGIPSKTANNDSNNNKQQKQKQTGGDRRNSLAVTPNHKTQTFIPLSPYSTIIFNTSTTNEEKTTKGEPTTPKTAPPIRPSFDIRPNQEYFDRNKLPSAPLTPSSLFNAFTSACTKVKNFVTTPTKQKNTSIFEDTKKSSNYNPGVLLDTNNCKQQKKERNFLNIKERKQVEDNKKNNNKRTGKMETKDSPRRPLPSEDDIEFDDEQDIQIPPNQQGMYLSSDEEDDFDDNQPIVRSITSPMKKINSSIMSDEAATVNLPSEQNILRPPVTSGQIQEEILNPILEFFKHNTNYDLMPYSGKVIVFDIDLPVREAFQVAANNDISFASLWDSEKSCLVGMLTVTDLIDILLLFHNQMDIIQDLVTHKTIREWRAMQKRNRPDKLIYVTPEDTILTAIHTLSKYAIHRLPVLSPKGALLHIITHSHLLAYLVQNLKFDSPIFQYSLEDLGIGTYSNVVTAKTDMQLFAAVCLFAKYKISAIPVVDDKGGVVDVFSRYDIVYFVRDGDYRLEMTLGEALKTRPRIPVFTCTKKESFEKVLRHLSCTRIHRLVCVDELSRVVGIVSISDIFSFLMKKQEEIAKAHDDMIPSILKV
ncbi:hypothetical protein ABK040_011523 [Willaertia magna]